MHTEFRVLKGKIMPKDKKAPRADTAPAQIAAAENHPIGTEDAPGWQYNGVSSETGKDYWIQTQDAGIMSYFKAVSYAKKHGVRLMSCAEGRQTYSQQGQLKGAFNQTRGCWLASHANLDAPVQRFDVRDQDNFHRDLLFSVRCVRDDDPRLQR